MRVTEYPSFFDQLDGSQKKYLEDLKEAVDPADGRLQPSGSVRVVAKTGDAVIGILEAWLLDDEQKQSLAAHTWDIFFLYATPACSLATGRRMTAV